MLLLPPVTSLSEIDFDVSHFVLLCELIDQLIVLEWENSGVRTEFSKTWLFHKSSTLWFAEYALCKYVLHECITDKYIQDPMEIG